MAQRSTLEIETVDEHAVGAEVRGEREAVGGIGKDAVGVRRFLTFGIRSFARVLNYVRWRECADRLELVHGVEDSPIRVDTKEGRVSAGLYCADLLQLPGPPVHADEIDALGLSAFGIGPNVEQIGIRPRLRHSGTAPRTALPGATPSSACPFATTDTPFTITC